MAYRTTRPASTGRTSTLRTSFSILMLVTQRRTAPPMLTSASSMMYVGMGGA